MKKEDMNFQEIKEGYMTDFWERKGKKQIDMLTL